MHYTFHARQRMRQRGVTSSEVDEALDNILTEYPSKDGPNRRVAHGTTKAGRELKIVVDTSDPVDVTIVTVAPVRV